MPDHRRALWHFKYILYDENMKSEYENLPNGKIPKFSQASN